MKSPFHFSTRVIHAGQEPDVTTGAVIAPIYLSSTYAQSSPGKHQGFEYSRTKNPTRLRYERCIADLENGSTAFAFASGMAATATVLELLNPGDHLIAMNDLYGGTFRLLDKVRNRSAGLRCSFVDLTDLNNFEQAITSSTKMVWIESPTNPLLRLVDLQKISELAHKHQLLVVVDNTFASPWTQRPLEHGSDIVVHSATKYLNGHCDVVGGVVVLGDNPVLIEKIAFLQNSVGAIQSAFDSFLILRGLKTLALRMEKHCENALTIAQWLEKHNKVQQVIYPGLESHPQHALAMKQMHRFGGMISFLLKGGEKETCRFLEHCQLFTLAESLGGVESLLEHPALMTHASVPRDKREKLGISDNLVRLSVGIEFVDDLINDLENALNQI